MERWVALAWAWAALGGCTPAPRDERPPRLVATEVTADGTELHLDFDEPVAEAVTGGNFSPGPPVTVVAGPQVTLEVPPGLKPGKGYRWTAEVKDAQSNLTAVAGQFYGPNDHPARLRLNEVRMAGSGPHTDFVELLAEGAGSLGGWTLDAWSGPEALQRVILPDVAVEAGDLVVVHYRPGSDAAPGAREFWCVDAKGLSATQGCLALRPRPRDPPTDTLAYAKDEGKGKALAAEVMVDADEVATGGATATRTWSRTDDAGWLLVANGCATPGARNKLTPWPGPTSTRKGSTKTKGRRRGRSRPRGFPVVPGSRLRRAPEEGPRAGYPSTEDRSAATLGSQVPRVRGPGGTWPGSRTRWGGTAACPGRPRAAAASSWSRTNRGSPSGGSHTCLRFIFLLPHGSMPL
jgi:hypothetical protein